ncbi:MULTISPECIES: hypothetical protein [Aminobacter]|jgi:hypothetical protein|uniref:Uncharacterized protein n=2 Tax=Aminobacter TaxID=31988 RepID=A0A380WP89_AMIAI|nr:MULTISPECIES: hypothetical protein [Aminobacter]MBB6469605.1 hypothetical protein [Aminobacter lissarensis]MBE1208435.1 hypothetical protein [Aminobacter carboxidus]TCS29822.1 hypothetical protein EDC40_101137 [Aminobacter aminovorans]SUU90671.1 Uncharacterised protein [Aminobacter aminovorans]
MAPIIRILLRYVTLPLLALGWILPEEQQALIADPEIVAWVSTGLGIIAPLVAEGWYWAARSFGWAK